MFSFEQITSSLPPIRNDEPMSLRQEIADEIIDHLQCGLRRELLLNGGDESAAKQNVLEKFGDPRQVARQLWFQAMWSKIMSQRIAIIMASTSMMASVAIAAMVCWMINKQSHDNEILLDRLAKLIPIVQSPAPTKDSNWSALTIKVALGSDNGPPAKGYAIELRQKSKLGEFIGQNKSNYHAILDDDGIENCGPVCPGRFEITVRTPWGEYMERSFTVFPNVHHNEYIVAPERFPDLAKVTLNLQGFSAQRIESNTAVLFQVRPIGGREVGHNFWRTSDNWTDAENNPCIMSVPQEGFFIEKTRSCIGPNLSFTRSKWKPCQMPLEFELPAHDYVADLTIVPLRRTDSPESARWNDRFEKDGERPFGHYQLADRCVTKTSEPNEWSIQIPDAVVRCVTENMDLPENVTSQ